MVQIGNLLQILQPYRNQHQKLMDEQQTDDIIDAILKAHKLYQPEYKKISSFFKGSNNKETAKNVWNFLKKNVPYKIESGSKQTIKSPSAILLNSGDCKHYASFAGGICAALGIPFAYRFASYKLLDSTPQHVFVVVNPNTENEIWIDPVLPSFNYKKAYQSATDRKMAIYSISGIGATKAQKAAVKAAKAAKKAAPKGTAKKAAKAELKAAKKAAGVTLGQKLKKGAKVVLKVAASPARNAFLLLVKINFGNLAVKLSKAWEKDASKVTHFWEGLGGKINNLKKQWEQGRTKKRIFGVCNCGGKCNQCNHSAEIGFAPAAAAAAAAPILAKVADLLKQIGIDPAELVEIGKNAINDKAQELVKNALAPKAETEAENIETANVAVPDDTIDASGSAGTSSKKSNYILPAVLIGGGLLYLATRKK